MLTASTVGGYGRGEATIEDEAATDAEVALTQAIRARFASPSYQPPLMPKVALELQQLSQRDDVPLDVAVKLLESDAMIAGMVLKRARGAMFGSAPVTSLAEAVRRMGMGGLRDLVWEIVMSMKIFRAPRYAVAMESVRKHSLLTAQLCRRFAQAARMPADNAFLCGLLHDVGLAAAIIAVSESSGPPPDEATLGKSLYACHHELSALIARFWNLPVDVQRVLELHHNVMHDGLPDKMAAVVFVSHDVASQLGAPVKLGGPERADRTERTMIDRAFGALGISDAALRAIGQDAQKMAAALK